MDGKSHVKGIVANSHKYETPTLFGWVGYLLLGCILKSAVGALLIWAVNNVWVFSTVNTGSASSDVEWNEGGR